MPKIQLAQQVMPHISDARNSKTSFQLPVVLSHVRKIAASTVAKNTKPGVSPWEAVGQSISQLVEECSKLLPSTMEVENVVKSKSHSNVFSATYSLQFLAPHLG
jgi:dynactin 1